MCPLDLLPVSEEDPNVMCILFLPNKSTDLVKPQL